MLCYEVSQTICKNKYFENDLLFLLLLCNDLKFVVLGSSPVSIKFSRLQKTIIRIMMCCRNRDSRRKLFFINWKFFHCILNTFFSFFLTIRNKNQFLLNSELYQIHTRQHANIHQPSANVIGYHKCVYYLGVRLFNMFHYNIKKVSGNTKKFKVFLQKFLCENSF